MEGNRPVGLVVAGLVVLALVGCALAVAGCGDSGSSAATETRTALQPREGRSDERASRLRLSRADCAALAARVRGRLGMPLRAESEPSPPLSRCSLTGRGADVNVYLDAAYAASQRYANRITEQAQFGAPDPARLPHPVPGVGDRAAKGYGANWVPGYSTLFAVRGNRWLTVAYSVPGAPRARRRAEAAGLARVAFGLSAR